MVASLVTLPSRFNVVEGMGQEDARVAQDFIGRDMLLHAVVLLEHPLDLQPSARPRQLAFLSLAGIIHMSVNFAFALLDDL